MGRSYPLDSFTGISDTALVYGAGFQWTWPDEKAGSDLHLLIDDIRITDGTNNPITSVPNQCGGVIPDIWPKYMVTGFSGSRKSCQFILYEGIFYPL